MPDVCGLQTDHPQAVVTTVLHPYPGPLMRSRCFAVTRVYRRLPSGALELIDPLWTQSRWLCSRTQARFQHERVVARLQRGTLPHHVQSALFPPQMFPPPLPTPTAGAIPALDADFLAFLHRTAN